MWGWLTWAKIGELLNSNFGAALIAGFIGSLAGAWGGAWAAQRIAEKGRVRVQLLQEINDVNAGIELSNLVCIVYLNLKEQYVQSVWDNYRVARDRVLAHHEGLRSGAVAVGTALDIHLELTTLDLVRPRMELLEKVVLEKVAVIGRPRPLVSILGQTMEGLNISIEARNKMIGAVKTSGAPVNARVNFLFGVRGAGGVDETFGNLVEAVHTQTDDCIYFSWRLCKDLEKHGRAVKEEFERRFGGPVPDIQKVVWDVDKKKLLPPLDQYKGWEQGFPQRVRRSRGRKVGKLRYWLRKKWRGWFGRVRRKLVPRKLGW